MMAMVAPQLTMAFYTVCLAVVAVVAVAALLFWLLDLAGRPWTKRQKAAAQDAHIRWVNAEHEREKAASGR
jgi:peptidoglycan/LPS O-acetylase OafA/YrhL